MNTTAGTSSATSISVDTASLEGWANELRGCVEPLRELSGGGAKWAAPSLSGDGKVDAAVGSFLDAWSYAGGAVMEDLTRMADAITVVAQMFAATDSAVAEQFRAGEAP